MWIKKPWFIFSVDNIRPFYPAANFSLPILVSVRKWVCLKFSSNWNVENFDNHVDISPEFMTLNQKPFSIGFYAFNINFVIKPITLPVK